MDLRARDIMQKEVRTVTPDTTLTALERLFLDHAVGGFPVVVDGKLVGVVSRSDIVRHLCVEQSLAEEMSDYYYTDRGLSGTASGSLEEIALCVGKRLEELTVKDMMVRRLFTIKPDDSLDDVARAFIKHHVHRLIVAVDGTLEGLISSLDLVRLICEGRVKILETSS